MNDLTADDGGDVVDGGLLRGADVEGDVLTFRQVGGGGEHVGADDVGYVGVAAGLLAVAVDGEGLAGVAQAHEVGDNEDVGALGGLPGAVDVEVAEGGDAEAEEAGEDTAVLLAHELLEGVGGLGLEGHVLAHDVGWLVAVDAGR